MMVPLPLLGLEVVFDSADGPLPTARRRDFGLVELFGHPGIRRTEVSIRSCAEGCLRVGIQCDPSLAADAMYVFDELVEHGIVVLETYIDVVWDRAAW